MRFHTASQRDVAQALAPAVACVGPDEAGRPVAKEVDGAERIQGVRARKDANALLGPELIASLVDPEADAVGMY
jgi:hypothetical protein